MCRPRIVFVVLLGCCLFACSQQNTEPAFSLFDNKVSFVPPPGLRQLTKEEIARRFSAVQPPPQYVFAQDNDVLAVKIYLQETPEDADLARIKGFVERTQGKYFPWITSEIVTVNGKQWFHYEWQKALSDELEGLIAPPPIDEVQPEPTPDDRPFRYNEWSTLFEGRLLQFVFQCQGLDKDCEPSLAPFLKSANSIAVKN